MPDAAGADRSDAPSPSGRPLVATYRVQLTPSFGLQDAARAVPYLARLGISHVYTSSYLQAAPGSRHGYDTTDHGRVDDELGGEEGLAELRRALQLAGLGNVVDVVPNHMSVEVPEQNPRWWNVLANGPTSSDGAFFDIDWDDPDPRLHGKVLVPILTTDLDEAIASGEVRVDSSSQPPAVHVGALRLPLATGTAGADAAEVLGRQHYVLANWRETATHLNYRRFFDVTTLAGVRVEDADVFSAVHERTLAWVGEGTVDGLRIDHPDGLRDPAGYLQRLRDAAPNAWITVEKILEPGEELPDDWPVDGTTGYDSMALITGLLVDPAGEQVLDELFATTTGEKRSYAEQLAGAKGQVLDLLFSPELNRLTQMVRSELGDAAPADDVRRALRALLCGLRVYRTYVTAAGPSPSDVERMEEALAAATELEPDLESSLLESIAHLVLSGGEVSARFQQLSGPAMAKGAEDTMFYRYNRLTALNEVGFDPAEFGVSLEHFHSAMQRQSEQHPRTMVSTSTHDTKRSEDVRSRIALISEIADEWSGLVRAWIERHERYWRGEPDRSLEHLVYQTAFGAHPLPIERLTRYLEKVVREAKQRSSWTDPSPFEDELMDFARAVTQDATFRADLDALVDRTRRAWEIAVMAQLVLRMTLPGIPDTYQGAELVTSTLVDPDNRDDVDFDVRTRMLDDVLRHGPSSTDDRKLWATQRLLELRVDHLDAFAATYVPLAVTGAAADRYVAYRRGDDVIVIVARRPVAAADGGSDQAAVDLPEGQWANGLALAPDRAELRGGTGVEIDRIVAGSIAAGSAVLVRMGDGG